MKTLVCAGMIPVVVSEKRYKEALDEIAQAILDFLGQLPKDQTALPLNPIVGGLIPDGDTDTPTHNMGGI